MRVLVVDPDEGFASEVSEIVRGRGVEAVHAASPDQMSAQMRIRDFDAVVIDLSLRRMNGFDVARGLRVEHPASELEIILVSPRHKPDAREILSLKSDVEARFFMNKPIRPEALINALNAPKPVRRPEPQRAATQGSVPNSASTSTPPRTAAPTPSPASKVKRTKPKKKVAIDWENLSELVVLWTGRKTGTLVVAGSNGGTAQLFEGGVVAAEGRAVVKAALLGGVVAFKEGPVDAEGDWSRMGKLLFKAARAGSDARTLRRYLNAVPRKNEFSANARLLPLHDDARAFVGHLDDASTVGEIIDRWNLPIGDLSKDIIALTRMGLIHLQRVGDEADSAQSTPNDGGREASLPRGESPEGNDLSERDQLYQRLCRESETIRDAPPPVVLGVPGDATRKLVDAAAERMRRRYGEIIARRDIDQEVRSVALEIAKRVDQAHRNFNFDPVSKTGGGFAKPVMVDEVEQLLNEGREFIGSKAWSAADKVLAKAHQKRIDHVPVLANLGWARLHNPDVDLETRTEEGKDFLLLAEQFDPYDSDGQYFLAQVLLVANRLDAAEQRAERAAEAAPDDPSRQALLRKIRAKLREISTA